LWPIFFFCAAREDMTLPPCSEATGELQHDEDGDEPTSVLEDDRRRCSKSKVDPAGAGMAIEEDMLAVKGQLAAAWND
jgi:hypothetical protein